MKYNVNMRSFTLVVFGFTSNLSRLKIIPALYDMEADGTLDAETRVIGVGRKTLNVNEYVSEVLAEPNRHHLHDIDSKVANRLKRKVVYYSEDFADENGSIFKKLKSIKGEVVYYLATYPNLYAKIFQSLKDYDLNKQTDFPVRILVEKPIGQSLQGAKDLNSLLSQYFKSEQVYRVDHYLGKEALRNIFQQCKDLPKDNISKVEIVVTEDFGVGKRGAYYDVTGALVDMGQNHLLQMLAAVFSKSINPSDREEVLQNLEFRKGDATFGQYKGYRNEDNVNQTSKTETFFALKANLRFEKNIKIPIYMASGKKLDRNEARTTIFYEGGEMEEFVIPTNSLGGVLDPYQRLILDAVSGDQTFFNSASEIEASWDFIDEVLRSKEAVFEYDPGSSLVESEFSKLQ